MNWLIPEILIISELQGIQLEDETEDAIEDNLNMIFDCLYSNIHADLLLKTFNYIEIKYPQQYKMSMIDDNGNEIELGICENVHFDVDYNGWNVNKVEIK